MNTELEKVENKISATLSDAVNLVLENAKEKERKFKEAVEIVLNLSLDKDESLRGSCFLPNSHGKERKIIVFIPEDNSGKTKSVLESGADVVGYQSLIAKISAGEIDKNAIYMTSASFMKDLKEIAKVMGSKGLMPNPKSGTLNDDLESTIPKMKNKVAFFKSGKTNMIQARIGSVSSTNEELVENIKYFVKNALSQAKNAGRNTLKSAYIKSTMTRSVKVPLSELV